uniref:Alpha 1,4-glycosyltransferase domain-containing protein n=1 Tax=Eucampia antarctica TaxID=49252 RepID=A0A7S2VY02_9STRA|mmetsp:Transcript_11187/g.10706  ORF Transcript_11187/g.10706 Transcript_11187/m.10706 type:complete len:331 (+) Transcript_11187:75-1067(+)
MATSSTSGFCYVLKKNLKFNRRILVFTGTLLVTTYSYVHGGRLGREYLKYIKSLYHNGGIQKSLKRPVIHTYYAKKLEHLQEDWDSEEHWDMLSYWKDQWESAGWDTRILTEEDAKQHPYYDTYQTDLEKLKVSSYNYYCFHRWLAMVVVGGGWMSDYDVVPLHMDQIRKNNKNINMLLRGDGERLPHDGEFTSFCSTVPCLMSGSAAEWDRIISQLMSYVPQYKNEHFSDMFAMFRYFRSDSESFHMYNQVATHLLLLGNDPSLQIDCDAYKGQVAWHFSHHTYGAAIKTGNIVPPEEKVKSRAWYMKIFLNQWLEQCKYPSNQTKRLL